MLRHILFGISLLLLLLSSSCSIFFTPLDPQSEEERFERFPAGPYPVEQPVQIYWNPHKVPYIEAQNDADLAFGFGLVSAHLRMGQMEFLRRISQFRFSEMGGPVFVPTLDRTFQTIHAPISIEELYADLPAESRVWAENFVKGVNYYLRNTPEDELPKEYSILDWEKEYWKREDILRIGRAVSADLNWGLYALWLQQETPEQAKAVWARVLESGARSVASFDGNLETQALQKLLWENGRSGSNTVVVSGEKTSTGAAIMANDPHLGVTAPNIWLIVGLKSPTYHTVGLTIPGTAVIGVGRNPDIAWGGTNMRGVSSHLFEVTEDDIIGSKQVTIRKRWWFDEEYSIRLSTKGPVLTDVPFFEREDGKMFAIYWTGQEPSDELTAYLQASRARNWDEFKQAFESYSIFALNMLYADTAGNIGMLPGYRQPVLADMSEFALPIKSRSNRVTKVRKVSELPAVLNPSSGFLASSNNKPFSTDYPLAYSYSNDDRISRLQDLLSAQDDVDLGYMKQVQQDVFSIQSNRIIEQLRQQYGDWEPATPALQPLWRALLQWDSQYQADSKGALVFQLTMYHLAQQLEEQIPETSFQQLERDNDWKPEMLRLIPALERGQFTTSLTAALAEAAPQIEEYQTWGQLHRQRMQWILGAAPVVGSRFRFYEYGAPGSIDTVAKSAHGFSDQPEFVTYGANSRHLSDLSDPDANYFVLLGGQDGWLQNPHLYDQVELWRRGEYIHMPLTMDKVRAQFQHRQMTLGPN